MATLTRLLSRPTAKPYRTHHLEKDKPPHLNDDGQVDFAPDDLENPQNWSTKRRCFITGSTILLVTNATFASSSPSGCLQSIAQDFEVSTVAAGLTLTLFLLGYCAGPLFFAPLSEFYGRRKIFYISFLLYLAFTFLCAFAPNFGSLLVGRFLTGTFVSAPLTNGPGVMADLWSPVARLNAMAAFSAMLWVGPALGPIISGFLEITKDWRWSFYVLLWLGGASALLMFTIPETFAPIVLKHKAERARKAKIPGYEDVKAPIEMSDRSLVGIYKVSLTRPWIIMFDPISLLCAIYLSVVYLLLYMLFSIYPIVFQEKRGMNPGVGELPLLGTAIGAVLGAIIVVIDSRRQQKLVDNGKLEPEDRLVVAMVGGVIFAACNFWLAWSGQYSYVHWIVPTLAGCFLSMGMSLIFVSILTYIVDSYLMYAASAIAANTIMRSALASAAPLFTNQMFHTLGVGGGGSLIGGLSAVLAVIPFAFYRYGKQVRIKSKFAPTDKEEGEGGGNGPNSDRASQAEEGRSREVRRSEASPGNDVSSSQQTLAEEDPSAHAGSRAPKDKNVHQNSLGEPRDENTRFGKEGQA